MQYLGIIGRVLCRGTGYEAKWEVPNGTVWDALGDREMRMGLFVRLATTATLVSVLIGGCQFGSDAFKAEFARSEELTSPVTGITMLDIHSDVGKIHLDAADVAEIQVRAEIEVKAATEEKAEELAEGVRIVMEPYGETMTVKAIKPAGFGRNQLCVDFTITAPANLALKCTTNVGEVRTTGFTGHVEVFTNVGTIICTGLHGSVDLRADVGDIRAEYAPDAPPAIHVDASTNVGSIEFAGPKDISAKLTAEANVGSINTDRPLTVTGNHLTQSIRASFGGAEGQISLRTNVGSVRIR
jgi:hypothetical protein